MAMIKNPFFARASTYEVMAKAFEPGGIFYDLDRIAYIFVLDTGFLYHVSVDKVIRPVVGDNPKYVQRFDELPPITEADEGLLYIVGDVVYSFYDGAYHPTYEAVLGRISEVEEEFDKLSADYQQFKTDITSDLNTFKTDVESEISSFKTEVQDDIAEINTAVIDLDGKVKTLQGDVSTLDTSLNSLSRTVTSLGRQLSGKADKATTLSGYGITDAYTKSETKTLIGDTGGEPITQYVADTVSNAMELTEV